VLLKVICIDSDDDSDDDDKPTSERSTCIDSDDDDDKPKTKRPICFESDDDDDEPKSKRSKLAKKNTPKLKKPDPKQSKPAKKTASKVPAFAQPGSPKDCKTTSRAKVGKRDLSKYLDIENGWLEPAEQSCEEIMVHVRAQQDVIYLSQTLGIEYH